MQEILSAGAFASQGTEEGALMEVRRLGFSQIMRNLAGVMNLNSIQYGLEIPFATELIIFGRPSAMFRAFRA